MFSEKLPIELAQAKELILERKMDEALEIITNFEQNEDLTPLNQLSILLLKGRIHAFYLHAAEAVELGEKAYQLSQKLGIIPGIVEALNLRARMVQTGKVDKALENILEAERLMDSISHEKPTI